LNAPSRTIFLISLILAIIAWVAHFTSNPYIGGHPSALLTVAFVILASDCLLPL
jgi:hypothetical protein